LTRNRIVATLQVVSAALFGVGVLLVVGAMLWTASHDALVYASGIAIAAFGLPAGVAYVIAYWLDGRADPEHRKVAEE
jgi:hypothetical protein